MSVKGLGKRCRVTILRGGDRHRATDFIMATRQLNSQMTTGHDRFASLY